jgi:pyoverdine/dityrosine biosynthesis protein Dit1
MNIKFLFENKKSAIKHQESTEEAIIKYGREQIRKLVEKGLRVPVVLL